jgi:small membrane protein
MNGDHMETQFGSQTGNHLGIQIILVGFAAYALLRALQRFRKGGLSVWQFVIWSAVWLTLAVLVLLPNSTARIAALLGVGRGVDVAIYVSLALLFYIAFRQLGKIEDLERQITRLVRAHALRDFEREQLPRATTTPPRPPGPSRPGPPGSPAQ